MSPNKFTNYSISNLLIFGIIRIEVCPTGCPVVLAIERALIRYLLEERVAQCRVGEIGTSYVLGYYRSVVAILSDDVVRRSEDDITQIGGLEVVLSRLIHEVLPHTGEDHVLYHSTLVRVLQVQAIRPAREYGVVHVQGRVTTDVHRSLERTAARAVGSILGHIQNLILRLAGVLAIKRADQSNVREDRVRQRRVVRAITIVVRLKAVRLRCIGVLRIAYAQQELQFALETIVRIELIVPAFVSDQVFRVHRTTEPLERILGVPLQIPQPGHVSGYFNSHTGEFDFNASIPSLNYNGQQLDSIMVLDSRFSCDTVKNTFTDRLVEEFRTQMESRGYTYVAIEDVRDVDDPAHADLGIQLTYIAETDYYTDYVDPYWWLDYPGYWSPSYWGGWGSWYYPYPVTYQFTTHSLMAEMADLGAAAGEDQKLPVVWNCVINGESGSARSDLARFLTAIGQAFSQSAYLDVASE